MGQKAAEEKGKKADNVTSELSQLRDIVFGDAQRQLIESIDKLRTDLTASISSLKKHNDEAMSKLRNELHETENSLLQKLSEVDTKHVETSEALEDSLNKAHAQLSSDIEMTDTSSKEDADALHNRIDKETRQLTQMLNEYHAQAMDKLTEVNHELNTSKTDRKTLAKLLAAMATNLEADDSDE